MSADAKKMKRIPFLLKELYAIVEQLEELFPGRKFTPDGHLVGSIGEVIAAYEYDLELLPNSQETHDAQSPDGKLIQIKATQTNSVAISSEPEYLIVLKIHRKGGFDEIYNGTGGPPWNAAGPRQKNGQRRIGLTKLKTLMSVIQQDTCIKRKSHNKFH